MNSILAFYNSSVGKKVLMSLTGLFLVTFLIEHLLGNLLLYANDEGAMYEAYGEFLVSNPVIRTIEIFLFAAFIFHALIGVLLWFINRRTRPEKYEVYRLKDNSPLASRTTIISGLTIGVFLYIHLSSFFYPLRFSDQHLSSYELVLTKFADPIYVGFYLFALLLLGYHLRHGFQSAFQTLGWRSSRYIGVLDGFAFIIWFIVPLLYATIPVYFYFFAPVSTTVLMGGN